MPTFTRTMRSNTAFRPAQPPAPTDTMSAATSTPKGLMPAARTPKKDSSHGYQDSRNASGKKYQRACARMEVFSMLGIIPPFQSGIKTSAVPKILRGEEGHPAHNRDVLTAGLGRCEYHRQASKT